MRDKFVRIVRRAKASPQPALKIETSDLAELYLQLRGSLEMLNDQLDEARSALIAAHDRIDSLQEVLVSQQGQSAELYAMISSLARAIKRGGSDAPFPKLTFEQAKGGGPEQDN